MSKIKLLFLFCQLLAVFLISCLKQPAMPPSDIGEKSGEKKQQDFSKPAIFEQTEIPPNKIIPLSFLKLDGYFFKNHSLAIEDINFFIVNSKTQFSDNLGETAIKKPLSKISFDKSIVVIIALKPSNYKSAITVDKAEYADSAINIYFSTSTFEPKLYYSANNSAAFEIERKNPITSIFFYINGKMKKEVLFGMRNKHSPKSLADLKKSYLGIYKGILPAADLSDMNASVELQGNSNYILKESRPEIANRVFETSGKWIPTDDLSSVVLNPDKDKSGHIFLYFIDNNTVELLDAYGDKSLPKQYRLKK